MNKTKLLILIGCLTVFCTNDLFCQKKQLRYSKFFHSYYYRGPVGYVVGLGTSLYRGSVCGRPDCNTYSPLLDIGINYKLFPHFSVGTEINYFHLKAQSHGTVDLIQFSSSYLEWRVYGRVYLFDDKIKLASDKNRHPKKLIPYFLFGLSALYYHPTSIFKPKGSSVSYDKSISGVTLGVSLGAGLRLALSKKVSLLGEMVYCVSPSDYLDNVPSKDGQLVNDAFATVVLKLQVVPFSGYSKH